MGCGCGQKKVAYEVTLKDGTKVTKATTQEATQVIRAAGGGTMRPVKKA